MNLGLDLIEICAVSPRVYLGNIEKNVEEIKKHIAKSQEESAPDIIVFPEASLTGYTCGDLFFQDEMTLRCNRALADLAAMECPSILVVGAPQYIFSKMYNCAVVISENEVKGIVPKTFLPTYNEFYERRWFDSPPNHVEYLYDKIPVGNSLVFKVNEQFSFAIDVCEDLWAPIPPSTYNCLNGANLVLNLSASNEIVGKHSYRTKIVAQQSAKMNCAYVYVSSGIGESTTDTVFLANHIIAQNGHVLENKQSEDVMVTRQVIDYGLLNSERKRNTTFRQSVLMAPKSHIVELCLPYDIPKTTVQKVDKLPFVPHDVFERYKDITRIQHVALQRRLQHINCKDVVIGVSGGLDSTLALMVAVEAFDALGLPRSGIHAISMPCFGTSERTRSNARKLSEALGLDFREIDISESVTKHMADIGADINVHDLTYENCQARERTQVLMDLATFHKGIVVGTGDMSEMAIGWCTYNGDHMSMYNVNCGVPKTLVKHLVKGYACDWHTRDLPGKKDAVMETLLSIADTEISPELLPPDKDGKISQKTEDIVGPYELTDFFLFYTMRYDFSVEKIAILAKKAFEEDYSEEEIDMRYAQFRKRFYANQFKRSCIPDGPKIGSICLSPRADLRMPSDAVL